jgi:hypothetical protein
MNRNTELAMLAGASYEASRSDINKFPIPEGWSALSITNWPYAGTRDPQSFTPNRVYWQDGATGFEGAAYTKGNEIVVSFAGTDFDNEKYVDVIKADLPLGQGNMTEQFKQAADIDTTKNIAASAGKCWAIGRLNAQKRLKMACKSSCRHRTALHRAHSTLQFVDYPHKRPAKHSLSTSNNF